MLKVDVTQGGNPLHEQLILHYEVKGVPTIVFLDRNGVEHRDVRLVDYLPPEQFLGRMRELLKNGGCKMECNHAQGQVFSQRAQRQTLKEF